MQYKQYKTLILNRQTYTGGEILDFCNKSESETIRNIGHFMKEWMDDEPTMKVQTSGSTGTPKGMEVRKDDMLKSAEATAAFFEFKEKETALLCLPMSYIAGKMMVVRALRSHLNLYCQDPSSDPLSRLPDGLQIDFAPLTPMQLDKAFDSKNIKTILLGGGAVHPDLEKKVQSFKAAVYLGYGMTETLSHIAVREVNGADRSSAYTALPGIELETDERGCLVIQTPFRKNKIITNDLVELRGINAFEWKGRVDNVVNSGGIKLFPEEIEHKIAALIDSPFFVAGMPDKTLGEKLCLFIEGEGKDKEILMRRITEQVGKYEVPRQIVGIAAFERTLSGKIKRKETLNKWIREQKNGKTKNNEEKWNTENLETRI